MPKPFYSDLPHNDEAEMACIGSALINEDCAISVLTLLKEEDFFNSKNKILYKAMDIIRNEKRASIDTVTVTDQLLLLKEFENIGGADYLRECCDSVVSFGALDFYIKAVSDDSTLRKLIIALRDIDEDYKTNKIENVNDFIGDAENQIRAALEQRRIQDFMSTKAIAPEVREQIAKASATVTNGVTGLTTGYDHLNKITGGFHKGEVIILAARPSIGKTTFAINLALKAATRGKCPVGIFSLEMTRSQLFNKLIAIDSGVYANKIQTGDLSPEERVALDNSIKKISETSIYIDDTPRGKISDIMQKCRRLAKQEPGLGLIVIDYLGLIETGGKDGEARHEAIRKVSAALKGLALELQIPILVLCQLSRDMEKRDSKKPLMSDLRDSGSIEQDADIVMLMSRSDYYGDENKKSNKEPKTDYQKTYEAAKESAPDLPGNASFVDVIVAKNRNGSIGNAGFFFFKAYGLFQEPNADWLRQYMKLGNNSIE